MSAMDGNELQRRLMLEQVAEAAVTKFRLENPDLFVASKKNQEIPAPLKWLGAIAAGVLSVGSTGLFVWMVTGLASVQITLARVEERIASMDAGQKDRVARVEDRVARLEENRNEERK
jgi:hypothetical protein